MLDRSEGKLIAANLVQLLSVFLSTLLNTQSNHELPGVINSDDPGRSPN